MRFLSENFPSVEWTLEQPIISPKQAHVRVWPEMLEPLRQSGWRNYSLFLRPDGLLVG